MDFFYFSTFFNSVDDQIWKKLDCLVCLRFLHFQSKIEEWAKLEDLNIQSVLKHENGLKGMKGSK
jgi:hypothetical protein